MADLTVPWRSVCFLVVPNWFCRTEAENYDISISAALVGSPPINVSVIPECLSNIHHLYHFSEFLVAVALVMPLESSRLPLARISSR